MRLAGLIDSRGPGLPEAVGACLDDIHAKAYAAGRPACFVRLRPGAGDQLFAARLLLRDDVPSVAVDPVAPDEKLGRELAAYWGRGSRVVARDRLWTVVGELIGSRPEREASALAVFTAEPNGALARALRAQGAGIFGAAPVALLSPRFGRALFIIGNNAADGALIALLRRFGGDAVLTTACPLRAYGRGRAKALAEAELGRPVPADEMAQWQAGIGRPAALLLGEVAAAARELFVPSAWLAGEIATRYGRQAAVLPMAAAAMDSGAEDGLAAMAAGLHAEACVWAMEMLRFWGVRVRLALDCPAMEWPGLTALAARLGVAGQIGFGASDGTVVIVLAMRGGDGLEAVLVAAAASGRRCVASRCLAETVAAPDWVRAIPDQPSPPLLAEAICAALAMPAPDAAGWAALHDPAAIAARLR